MSDAPLTIPVEDRTLAALTHLSGLAGYVIPFGGVVVPIVIWAVNRDSPIIVSLAKQALLLNLATFVLVAFAILLIITIILIPLVIILRVSRSDRSGAADYRRAESAPGGVLQLSVGQRVRRREGAAAGLRGSTRPRFRSDGGSAARIRCARRPLRAAACSRGCPSR